MPYSETYSDTRQNYGEKRGDLRMQIGSPLEIQTLDGKTNIMGICKNLSVSGVLFLAKEGFRIGRFVEISVKSGNNKFANLKAKIEVTRCIKDPQSHQFLTAGKILQIL